MSLLLWRWSFLPHAVISSTDSVNFMQSGPIVTQPGSKTWTLSIPHTFWQRMRSYIKVEVVLLQLMVTGASYFGKLYNFLNQSVFKNEYILLFFHWFVKMSYLFVYLLIMIYIIVALERDNKLAIVWTVSKYFFIPETLYVIYKFS